MWFLAKCGYYFYNIENKSLKISKKFLKNFNKSIKYRSFYNKKAHTESVLYMRLTLATNHRLCRWSEKSFSDEYIKRTPFGVE